MSSYQKAVLENGVTVVTETHSHVRSVCIGVWVKVGSLYETPTESGLSHAIEHMVFKGTKTRSALDIATCLESVGGDLNAFTDREVTCYHATTLCEHMERALDVLSDLTLSPVFDHHEFQRERKVLLQELSMVRDSPEEWIVDLFFKEAWQGHPLGQPILGNKTTIGGLTRSKLRHFFSEHYRPDNIVISAAGNLDHDRFVGLCRKFFSFQSTQKRLPLKPPPAKYHSRHKFVEKDREQLQVLIGYEGVGFRSPDRFDLLVMSYFLGGGMSSRLFQEVREKAALAYSVDSDYVPFADTGVLTVSVALSPRTLQKCLDIVGNEIRRLKEKPIEDKFLDTVKGQLKGTILLSADQMETRQESLGRNEILFGKFVSIEGVIAEIEAVTPERIQKLAQKVFSKERETVICLGKRYGKGDLSVITR